MATQASSSMDIEAVVRTRFKTFLSNFSAETMKMYDAGPKTYIQMIMNMGACGTTTLFVDLSHILRVDIPLATSICDDFIRYESSLKMALHELLKEHCESSYRDIEKEGREFFVAFHNLPNTLRIRELRMERLGNLVAINGTVTRTTEVRPELLYGRFICEECNLLSPPVEQQFKFTEPVICTTQNCTNRTKWRLDIENSRFIDWQRLRLQENADEVPPGSLPRTLDVILRASAVDTVKPGDKCTLAGTMIVVPDVSQLYKQGSTISTSGMTTGRGIGGPSNSSGIGGGVSGLKSLGVRDLTYRTSFLAQTVLRMNERYVNSSSSGLGLTSGIGGINSALEDAGAQQHNFTPDQIEGFIRMSQKPSIYADLVRSIAPNIHGHSDLKKGILLMLLGGVPKRTPEGTTLRGDINVCIVGDPSTAKSQFLKYVNRIVPRSVYTSGKASSAAGLTASVVKDQETGEFTIEAGALMLADESICCIDEFDKMNALDQVAIHEAMEQQTISISKAGIQATLNARTSILAAANPIFGRYDRSKTLRQNISISPPIMSRFDLFFIVLDTPDEASDERIARHIVEIHQKRQKMLQNMTGGPVVPLETLQSYLRFAKSLTPVITESARRAIVKAYARLRMEDDVGVGRSSYRITVRQLESVVRLSEALAKLHLDPEVKEKYVVEAFQLIKKSLVSVETPDIDLEEGVGEEDGFIHGAKDLNSSEMDKEDIPLKSSQNEVNHPSTVTTDASNAATSMDEGSLLKEAPDTKDLGEPQEPLAKESKESSSGNSVSFEKYQRIRLALTARLRIHEDTVNDRVVGDAYFAAPANSNTGNGNADGTTTSEDPSQISLLGGGSIMDSRLSTIGDAARVTAVDLSMQFRELVNWYVQEQALAGILNGKSEIKQERKIVVKILRRLIHKEGVVMFPIDYDADGAEVVPEEDRYVCLNHDMV